MRARARWTPEGCARTTAGLAALALVLARAQAASTGAGDEPDFARDVRPILASRCFPCHGPDEAVREADLRFDRREIAFADRGGYAAVVPRERAASELWLRVTDPDDPMPPADSGLELTASERDTLGRWIDAGAPWREHWAYAAPARPEPPAVADDAWPANAIDRFVLARLEAEGLRPAPEAPREKLLRRASLDLNGLPPTVEELDALRAGKEGYAAAVERLLASPRWGETMAKDWLDAARYGDTHGYHLDNERSLWPWRDWVIDAFNANMPFDRFTIEQLAGDLLPAATREQRIATGFNRCNPTTAEGGLIDEEYLVKYAVDRVDTTATVWMGMTLACAQCHDHKFDPVTQQEFYEFLAFFDDAEEQASDANALVAAPVVAVPSAEQASRAAALAERIADGRARLAGPLPETDAEEVPWAARWHERVRDRWTRPRVLAASADDGRELVLDDDGTVRVAASQEPGTIELFVATPFAGFTGVALDVEARDDAPTALRELALDVAPAATPGVLAPVRWALASAAGSAAPSEAALAIDGLPETAWTVAGGASGRLVLAPWETLGTTEGALVRVRLDFASAPATLALAVSEDASLAPARLSPWSVAGPFAAASGAEAFATAFAPETSFAEVAWEARPELQDGASVPLGGEEPAANAAYYLSRSIVVPDQRVMRVALGSDDALAVWVDGERVWSNEVGRTLTLDQDVFEIALRPGEQRLLVKVVNYAGDCAFSFRRIDEALGGLPVAVELALATPAEERDEVQRTAVREHWRRWSSPEWRALSADVDALEREAAALDAEVPRTMVMNEPAAPRQAHVLERGRYDRPGAPVTAGVPAALPPLPHDPERPPDRLALARWLVAPDHPLTARVTVNRLWQHFFGAGLVRTPEDFGLQGEFPSHPELLDWLAVELVESGWDLKHISRLIVASATYRQASGAGPDARERDPANRLYARGPRHRLDAEVIRDATLFASGLYVERIGGRSVKPYQPPGLWEAVAYTTSNTARFVADEGDALWRRSLYTFWKRTSPPPSLQLFDAPSRERCTVRRARTNTPLQALALLNDVQYVEAARKLAERLVREGGATDEERAVLGFRLTTARTPEPEEVAVVLGLVTAERAAYRTRPEAAEALLAEGASPRDATLEATEVAAWTQAACLLLNLDETITKD